MRASNGLSIGAKAAAARLTSPIGWLPGIHDIDLAELEIDHKCVADLLGVDHGEWQKE